MEVRTATEQDLAQLAAMRWDWRIQDDGAPPGLSKDAFVQECARVLLDGLREKTWAYWLAESDGEIIAHVFVQRVRKVPEPHRLVDYIGYVTNAYTRPEHRGKGVGNELLGGVVDWARQEDFDVLVVWPSERSVHFWERCGFRSQNDVMELDFRNED